VKKKWKIWCEAANDLGFEIQSPVYLKLKTGKVLKPEFLVVNFGAVNGTLVFIKSDQVWEDQQEIIDMGYTFSVFNAPGIHEKYNREDFIEILSEWGWCGDESKKPDWILDQEE